MASYRDALASIGSAERSVAEQAGNLGLGPPVSMRDMMSGINGSALAADVRVFPATITTPPGTALGGSAKLTVAGNGAYTFQLHMHGSGWDPYSFTVHLLLAGGGTALAVRKTGSVGGTVQGGGRDFDWTESGSSEALKTLWPALRDGALIVSRSYENTGVLGLLEHAGQALIGFLIANALIGPQAAAVVLIGGELMTGIANTSPGAFVGIAAAGATVLILGPGMVIPAVVAGLVAGAATPFSYRHLDATEEADARSVFDQSLDFPRIWITDLSNTGPDPNRAFTTLLPDGTHLLNVGNRYAGMAKKTLIHELVHVWQGTHNTFAPDRLWEAATNKILLTEEEAYSYAMTDRWEDMNIEAQASAVADWFTTHDGNLGSPNAVLSPLYSHIVNHIRPGVG